MADTMQFDLVSPERRLASVQATEIQLPGADGDMTAMPDHAPVITTLRPGIVRVVSSEGTTEYVVSGGFAEITSGAASVLAEHALPVSEMTQDILNGFAADAAEKQQQARPEEKDVTAKRVADIAALASEIGLTAS